MRTKKTPSKKEMGIGKNKPAKGFTSAAFARQMVPKLVTRTPEPQHRSQRKRSRGTKEHVTHTQQNMERPIFSRKPVGMLVQGISDEAVHMLKKAVDRQKS